MQMPRLLFVDDEAFMLNALRRLVSLSHPDWHVAVASSGEEALQALRRETFSVIVCDLGMDGMGGEEVLARVANEYPWVVRVIHSATIDDGVLGRLASLASYAIPKPAKPDMLMRTLEDAVSDAAPHDAISVNG